MKLLNLGFAILFFALKSMGADASTRSTCIAQAEKSNLSGSLGKQLCRGEAESGPVKCYFKARNISGLEAGDLVGLCSCAKDSAPVECVEALILKFSVSSQSALSFCESKERSDLFDTDCLHRNSRD
jgi:hypothetical protein